MSDQKRIIKLKFNDKEKEVQAFDNINQLIEFFYNEFSINYEDKQNLSLFYLDEDNDKIDFKTENDYQIFLGGENVKIIEGEIIEKDNEDHSMDQMKSGMIFTKKVPEQKIDLDLKNNIDSSSLANSLYSIDIQKRESSKENDIFAKDINQMKNMFNRTLEDNPKEKEIEIMKKKMAEMEEMMKKQNEEFKKKEEENKKKYKNMIAQKENEIKKQLEEKEKKYNEDRLKKENEMKEKYEFEMKSKIEIENKKLDEIKKKDIENQKKMEEMKKKEEEHIKQIEEYKKKEKENIKKIENEKIKIEEDKKKLEKKLEEIIKEKDLELKKKMEELKKAKEEEAKKKLEELKKENEKKKELNEAEKKKLEEDIKNKLDEEYKKQNNILQKTNEEKKKLEEEINKIKLEAKKEKEEQIKKHNEEKKKKELECEKLKKEIDNHKNELLKKNEENKKLKEEQKKLSEDNAKKDANIQEYNKKEQESLKKEKEILQKLEKEKKEKEEANKKIKKIEAEKKENEEKLKKEKEEKEKKAKEEKEKKEKEEKEKKEKEEKIKKEKEIKEKEEQNKKEKESKEREEKLLKEKKELEKKLKEEKEKAEKAKKESEEKNKKIQEEIKKKAKEELEKQKKESEEKIKKGIEEYKKQNENKIDFSNLKIEDDNLKMNIDKINQQSELFISKLEEMKKQCYDEINKKYKIKLQQKIKEIHNTILMDVQRQNQVILDSYVKQFEELEKKRTEEYNQMSQIMINNPQQNKGELTFSNIKTTHHGIKCEKCGKIPIIGNRYKCSVCNNYNLCESCEETNFENQEHKHNFIKIRNEEKIEVKKEEKKIIPREEVLNEEKKELDPPIASEYNYRIVSKKDKMNKEATEFDEKEVIFDIMLENNNNLKWPEDGRTRLVNDKNSDLKYKDILLNPLEFKQSQRLSIGLNINNMESGQKYCYFHFMVDNKIYGDKLTLVVNIKEHSKVKDFRDQYQLRKEDYSSEYLFGILKNNDFNYEQSFQSLFNN